LSCLVAVPVLASWGAICPGQRQPGGLSSGALGGKLLIALRRDWRTVGLFYPTLPTLLFSLRHRPDPTAPPHAPLSMYDVGWSQPFSDVRYVHSLLSAGADVNARDEPGNTALIYACAHGTFPVVQELLRFGAKVNMRDKHRVTALHVPCAHRGIRIVALLLKHEAHDEIRQVLEDRYCCVRSASNTRMICCRSTGPLPRASAGSIVSMRRAMVFGFG
jgi:hypothetical protein